MTTMKNYYVCLRFAKRPDLHMTVRYLENLTPGQMSEVVDAIDTVLQGEIDAHQFVARFCIEAWYGPRHTVRVLEPLSLFVWPNWMLGLMAVLPAGGSTYAWYPHVACKDNQLDVKTVAISLMCRKVEVARWDLV
ncbi:hypothetical protein LCGC14_0599530 [marine sediment metagenome]|uniref:Uncharacterized protein n=1 Tax=marine sediment metagenome TaxID=412755 RepID=A0A0F9UJA8_9ZZZZ